MEDLGSDWPGSVFKVKTLDSRTLHSRRRDRSGYMWDCVQSTAELMTSIIVQALEAYEAEERKTFR